MELPRKKNRAGAGWASYVWLIWLVYFIVDPVVHTFSFKRWIITLAATSVFLAMYFGAHEFKSRKKRIWMVAGITVLGLIFSPTNHGASVFFAYAASIAGFCGETEVAVAILIAVEVCESLVMWKFHLPVTVWAATSFLIAAIGAMNIQHAKRILADRRLYLAQEDIERLAKTAERERISRDMHDVLGHTLSVIILKSELASRMADRDGARAIQEIRDVERFSREALAGVRSALQGYRTIGLDAEIAQARATLQTAGIGMQVSVVREQPELGTTHEAVLAMVIREAVTNILRHSQASECDLRLTQCDGVCLLQIADNGRGSDDVEGQGIKGMRERIEMLGGSLRRITSPGTELIITIPRATARSNGTQ